MGDSSGKDRLQRSPRAHGHFTSRPLCRGPQRLIQASIYGYTSGAFTHRPSPAPCSHLRDPAFWLVAVAWARSAHSPFWEQCAGLVLAFKDEWGVRISAESGLRRLDSDRPYRAHESRGARHRCREDRGHRGLLDVLPECSHRHMHTRRTYSGS